jgi:DNA-binding XRE family transcriptional regulator
MGFLLEEILPQGFELSIYPFSDNESAARQLVKGRYNPELHLAIGMLRIFNAEDNNLEAHSAQQCNFRSEPYLTGAAMLDPYGPLFFVMAAQILPKVPPILGEMFCNAKRPEEVAKMMNSTFTR